MAGQGGATRWKKGHSGNPGGRPRGFAQMCNHIRRELGEGKELVDYAIATFRGQADDTGRVPDRDDRWRALEWLADRGWGKAVTPVDLAVVDEQNAPRDDFDPATLPRDVRDRMEAELERVLAMGDATRLLQ